MEAATTEQQRTTTVRQGAEGTAPKLQVLFTVKEVCELTGVNRYTLRSWIQKGWIKPATRSKGGRGNQHLLSGFQTLGIAIIAAAVDDVKDMCSVNGRVAVVKAMEALAQYDDELLLDEEDQDPHLAERAAAEIARCSLPSVDVMSPAMLANVSRVVAAIDDKVRGRNRTARRVLGEQS